MKTFNSVHPAKTQRTRKENYNSLRLHSVRLAVFMDFRKDYTTFDFYYSTTLIKKPNNSETKVVAKHKDSLIKHGINCSLIPV